MGVQPTPRVRSRTNSPPVRKSKTLVVAIIVGIVFLAALATLSWGPKFEPTPEPVAAISAAPIPVTTPSTTTPKCEPLEKSYRSYCVDKRMFDFLVCVEGTGGNRETRKQDIDNIMSQVVSAGAGMKLEAKKEQQIKNKIDEKFYPGSVNTCLLFTEPKPEPAPPTGQQKRAAYVAREMDKDAKLVADELESYGENLQTTSPEEVSRKARSSVEIKGGKIAIINTVETNLKSSGRWKITDTCEAAIDSLDAEIMPNCAAGTIVVNCRGASGKCVSCKSASERELVTSKSPTSWTSSWVSDREQESIKKANATLYVDRTQIDFVKIVSALSRLVSTDGIAGKVDERLPSLHRCVTGR